MKEEERQIQWLFCLHTPHPQELKGDHPALPHTMFPRVPQRKLIWPLVLTGVK